MGPGWAKLGVKALGLVMPVDVKLIQIDLPITGVFGQGASIQVFKMWIEGLCARWVRRRDRVQLVLDGLLMVRLVGLGVLLDAADEPSMD